MDYRTIGIIAGLTMSLSWAAGAILFKKVGEFASPFAMTLLKGCLSILFLGVLCLCWGWQPMSARCWAELTVSGLLGIAVGDTLFFASLELLSPLALLVFYMLGQIATALLALIFLHERLSFHAWIGIAVTLAGVAAVMAQQFMSGSEEQNKSQRRGIVLAILTMLCLSCWPIIAKKALVEVEPAQATFVRMVTGTLGMLVYGLLRRQVSGWLAPFRNARRAAFFVFAVAVVAVGGFFMEMVAFKHLSLIEAKTLGSLEPLFLIPISLVFFGEKSSMREIAGALLATCGVVLLINGGGNGVHGSQFVYGITCVSFLFAVFAFLKKQKFHLNSRPPCL